MSSTNTTNLNFTKPDIGSESNNWGNLLNTNFDELDKALGQILSKGVGGNSDISLSSSESQYAVLELTGTLTGNISVRTYNDSSRPYIVFNNTGGAYTLTFKTANGTGVEITQGQKNIIYSDGTNMVLAVSTGNLSSARTITLSGDVTGSVSTDFSTNPTITTAIDAGVIVDADVNSSAAIDATKIANGNVSNTEFQYLDNCTGEIQTQINAKIDGSALNASNLSSGTVPNTRFPATLPAASGANLTSLNGSNISSGTVADARISTLTSSKLTGALPAIDGSALTGISGVPASGTAVGAIRELCLYSSGGSVPTTLAIAVNTEITPSTYSSGGAYVSDVPEDISAFVYTSVSFPTRGFYTNTSHSIQSKTRATLTGTWRMIVPLYYAYGTTGGQGGFPWSASRAGLAMRIS